MGSDLVFGRKLPPISQASIAACPVINGTSWIHAWSSASYHANHIIPPEIRWAIKDMVDTQQRKYRQVLIRPQDCRGDDARMGSFWHLDIDVSAVLTPTWDDMQLTVASFGSVAETDFIAEAVPHDRLPPAPSLDLYTQPHPPSQEGVNFGTYVSAEPNQAVSYTSRHWHRGGKIRHKGWRLVLIVVDSDHLRPIDPA